MSEAIKCDRCGYYTRAARRLHINGVAYVYDLCPDCIRAFDMWMECQPVTGAPERVTNEGEMLHDTGVSGYRYHIIRDGTMRMVVKGSDLKDTDVVESVEEPDTREKLEADVRRKQREWSQSPCALDTNVYEVIGWLDRQAAITEREVKLRELYKFEENHREHIRSIEEVNQQLNKRIAELEREVATLKEHRAGNMERLHELTDECAELRKYRDEWKGIAEAAWAECEGYRAKLGAVLDAIREAERAAR